MVLEIKHRMHPLSIIACMAGLAMVAVAKNTAPDVVQLQGCHHEGQYYDPGESLDDGCKFCYCVPGLGKNGTMACQERLCDIPICPNHMTSRVLPGNCCPSCVET